MKKEKTFNIKKIDLNNPAKKHNKIKLAFRAIVTFIVTLFLASSLYGIFSFFTTYGLQSPIVLRSPIYRLHPDVLISPVSTKSASAIFDVGKIADRIYTLESSNGTNDGCRKQGLYNGYGFRQNSFEWICYPSHEAVRAEVINWLETNIKSGNIEKALCKYNQGIDEQNCTYAINYKSL